MTDYRTAPIDAQSAEQLAGGGLRFGLVDTADHDAFSAWYRADQRGFYQPRPSQQTLERNLAAMSASRVTGVWDGEVPEPVATVASWPAELTVPSAACSPGRPADGPRTLTSWAISSVTVAPTHRRRGIARAMLEAELRTAHSLGVPMAMLTASEATIYGRYGFAPASFVTDYAIDARRARWSGPSGTGRVRFAEPAELLRDARSAYDADRLSAPGGLKLNDYLWRHLTGAGADDERSAQLRAVRYDDERGTLQGFVVYRMERDERDFANHTVNVHHLVAATPDASSALWRYLCELDLVGSVAAPMRSSDEAFLWQLEDLRAVRTEPSEADHLWLRILDAPAVLAARGYAAAGTVVLDVADPLGFAAGRFLLEVDESGVGSVRVLSEGPAASAPPEGSAGDEDAAVPADAAWLRLGGRELGSLYLGGVRATTLARAGRVHEVRPGSASLFDGMFRSPLVPWLGIVF